MPVGTGKAVPGETRRLAAIMFTDIVGFSRHMGADEARTLRLLDIHNQIVQQVVAEHHGTVIKTVGDAFLVDFPSVVQSVQCAQRIQSRLRTHNAEQARKEQIHVRIGIHLGDIVQRDGDVFGDGVNIASRLQTLAEPDTICISQKVYEEVVKKIPLAAVVSLGRPPLKNIAERFRVYALLPEPPKGVRQKLQVQRLKLSRRARPVHWLSAAGLLLIVGTLVAVHYFPLLLFLLSPPRPFAPDTEATLPPLPLPDKPSIVVLPFANISNDPTQDYFSDGISEDITTDLSRLSGLFVISRNSAFTYKGKAVKIQEVGRELGVQYVLEGSVRKAGGQVRVTVQLIDADNDHHLWAERYDRALQDIFALQDEIVQKIVTTLKLQLTVMEQGFLVRKTTSNVEAYDYLLRGTDYHIRYTKEANAQARQMLEKAIELDAQYARAYSTLGWTYYWAWLAQWNPDPQTLEQALTLAQKAIALDDSRAHGLLAGIYLQKKQYEPALTEAERAAALEPNSFGYTVLGTVLNYMGRPEEAVEMVEKAIRLDPRSPVASLSILGQTYRLMGRYEEAIAAHKRALTANPNYVYCYVHLASMYGELGREAEARAAAAEILRLSPNFSVDSLRQRLPYKDPAVLERHLEALRRAGLK
jgi:adenylate cyclase